MREHPAIIIEGNTVVRTAIQMVVAEAGCRIVAALGSVSQIADVENCPLNSTVILIGGRGAASASDIGEIRAAIPSAAIVVLGGADGNSALLEVIKWGANVCLDDAASCDTFYKSLELASADLAVMSISRGGAPGIDDANLEANGGFERSGTSGLAGRQSECERMLDARRGLSPRESSILKLLKEGASNKLIAQRLKLTEATVKVHLKSILRKIRVKNRTQAAVWSMGHDELDVGLPDVLTPLRRERAG